MNDLRREMAALKARVRLLTLSMLGALVIAVMAGGGADAVARTLVESDSWLLKSKKVDGTLVNRLVVTTDVDRARVKVQNANLELEALASDPSGFAEGAISYNSTTKKVRVYNGTAWADVGGGGGGGGGSSGVGGRLTWISTTTLRLAQYAGDVVTVNGQDVTIGAGKDVLNSDPLITSTGTNSGAGPVASTTYHVYLSNASASYAASSLRLSATAPSLASGVKYLGTSGNALQWRFLGWARTNASNLFEDSPTKRFVINYYNRRALKLKVSIDPAVPLTWTGVVGGWRVWAGPTYAASHRAEFIANGEDIVYLQFDALAAGSGQGAGYDVIVGIGLDWTVGAPDADCIRQGALGQAAGNRPTPTAIYTGVPSSGYRYLQCLEYAGSTNVAWYGKVTTTTERLPGACGWIMG